MRIPFTLSRMYLVILSLVGFVFFFNTMYFAFVKLDFVHALSSLVSCFIAALSIRYVRRKRRQMRIMHDSIQAAQLLRAELELLPFMENEYKVSRENLYLAVHRVEYRTSRPTYSINIVEFEDEYDVDRQMEITYETLTSFTVSATEALIEKEIDVAILVDGEDVQDETASEKVSITQELRSLFKFLNARRQVPDDLRFASVGDILKLRSILA